MMSAEPIELKCGSSIHTVQMDPETCIREEDCNRTYHLYIPDSLCNAGPESLKEVGTLPLVFAVHCFGCQASAMENFVQAAQHFNFLLVRPEGVQSSWNAKYCCGYALDRNLDDVGFFSRIIDILDTSFNFVQKELVYGAGWSNGGYMVTYSAKLFRSVAPIAGYQYGDIIEINDDSPTGIFQHHSLNDPTVRFDGCCMNSTMKKCCCGISKEGGDQCTSVTDGFNIWAKNVNHCSDTRTSTGYTITYKDQSRGIECRSGNGCSANTTLCVYEKLGHFGNTFSKTFPMFEEIGDFFSRDACSMKEGRWSPKNKVCSCGDSEIQSQIGMMPCSGLITQSDITHIGALSVPSRNMNSIGLLLVCVGAIMLLIGAIATKYFIGSITALYKKNDGWDNVPTEEESEIELQTPNATSE